MTPAPTDPVTAAVPFGVRVAGAWAWRILLLCALLYVFGKAFAMLSIVAVPVVVALLLCAALHPIAVWLQIRGVPHALAVVLVLIGGILVVAAIVAVVVKAFINGLPDLSSRVSNGIDDFEHWLIHGPLKLSSKDVTKYIDSLKGFVTNHKDALTSGAVSTAVTIGHIVTGAFVTFFTLLFFLLDGRRIWTWVLNLAPQSTRAPLDGAGLRSFSTLVSFVRATLMVAFVDGAGIGIWCAILGVPLALPLGALVFLGAFVPMVGAVVSGIVAVIVALVAKGFLTAALVLVGVLAIQQLEGHVLQPLLLGRAVRVHPLAVVLGIGTGVVLAGIVGAIAAVPTIACLNVAVQYLKHYYDPAAPRADGPTDTAGVQVEAPPPGATLEPDRQRNMDPASAERCVGSDPYNAPTLPSRRLRQAKPR